MLGVIKHYGPSRLGVLLLAIGPSKKNPGTMLLGFGYGCQTQLRVVQVFSIFSPVFGVSYS